MSLKQTSRVRTLPVTDVKANSNELRGLRTAGSITGQRQGLIFSTHLDEHTVFTSKVTFHLAVFLSASLRVSLFLVSQAKRLKVEVVPIPLLPEPDPKLLRQTPSPSPSPSPSDLISSQGGLNYGPGLSQMLMSWAWLSPLPQSPVWEEGSLGAPFRRGGNDMWSCPDSIFLSIRLTVTSHPLLEANQLPLFALVPTVWH
jgi:hypothetical protein